MLQGSGVSDSGKRRTAMSGELELMNRKLARLQESHASAIDRVKQRKKDLEFVLSRCQELMSQFDISRIRSACESIEVALREVEIANVRIEAIRDMIDIIQNASE
jgi:hypothetical protein